MLHEFDNGICMTCEQRNFNPNEPRDPHTGKWGHGGAASSAVKDTLKVGRKINLGPDQRFAGSAKVRDSNGDRSVVLAGIDTPAGRRIRLGLVHPDDERLWRAAPKGSTVELDQRGVAELRATLAHATKVGPASVASYYADVRKADAADLPRDQWPNPETEIASGVINATWGDIHWIIQRDSDAGPEIPGIVAPGAGWSLGLEVHPASDTTRAIDPMYIDRAGKAKALDKALAELS